MLVSILVSLLPLPLLSLVLIFLAEGEKEVSEKRGNKDSLQVSNLLAHVRFTACNIPSAGLCQEGHTLVGSKPGR